jgi:hypothetical protein
MVHRAMLGSVERMIAVLTEHFGGKWCVRVRALVCVDVCVRARWFVCMCVVCMCVGGGRGRRSHACPHRPPSSPAGLGVITTTTLM